MHVFFLTFLFPFFLPFLKLNVDECESDLGRWGQKCCAACKVVPGKEVREVLWRGCYDLEVIYCRRTGNWSVEAWRRRRNDEKH